VKRTWTPVFLTGAYRTGRSQNISAFDIFNAGMYLRKSHRSVRVVVLVKEAV
jgi:hypothetical protein